MQARHVNSKKKTEDGEFFFLKGLTNRFWLTLKSCSWLNKVLHDRPSIKWTLYKCNDILLKVD